MISIWLGVFTAMIMLIAAYLLRRASRPFDPAIRPPRGGQRIAASIAALDHSDALAIICPPCNGQPGRCTCAGLCGHPACIGDHTVLHDMAAELDAMLREGDR